jgi:PAS domain S-box-containing protein
VDEAGRIQCVNARVETLFRIPREGLLGQPIDLLLPEWFHHLHPAQRVDYVRHPSALSIGPDPPLFARRADGSEFPVEIMSSSIEVERRQMALVVVRDISARKRLEQQRDEAEEELRDAVERVEERTREVLARSRELDETNRQLREANKEFATIYERGGIFVGHLNLEGVVVDANPACVEGLGFARADIIGRPHWEAGWWRTSPEEDRKSIRKRVELALAGEESHAETSYLTGDGEERIGDLSMTPIKVDGRVVSVFIVGVDITERARQYQVTFENAAVGIVHATTELKWGRVNDAMGRIVGYRANELINKPVLDIIHPDHREAVLRDVERIRDGKTDSYIAERCFLRKDGTTVWVRTNISALRKGDGSVERFVGVIQDISGRKHAEEQVHLLMREANHRARNMLSLVQAVARQTTASEPVHFVETFIQRIQALAVNQNLLDENRWHGADVDDLVRVQLAHFADLVGSRIAVRGPKLRLNAAAAQAVGLAIHELATNASKYGALSNDGGRVEVDWWSDACIFAMHWTERGGPPVSPPSRRGFGTTVVESMAKRAVGGEVDLNYARSGLEWHLTCPAANALEAMSDAHLRGDAECV